MLWLPVCPNHHHRFVWKVYSANTFIIASWHGSVSALQGFFCGIPQSHKACNAELGYLILCQFAQVVENRDLWRYEAHGPLTRYAKLRVAHAPGILGTFSCHRLQRKPLVSDPGMHHGTCVTHAPWCMSGSLTRGDGKNVPGIPGACAIRGFTHLARGPCWRRFNYGMIGCENEVLVISATASPSRWRISNVPRLCC